MIPDTHTSKKVGTNLRTPKKLEVFLTPSEFKIQEVPEKFVVMQDVQMKLEGEEDLELKEAKNSVINPGLCEYELIRLENIRQREALFAELNLNAAKVEASPRIERTVSAPSRYYITS